MTRICCCLSPPLLAWLGIACQNSVNAGVLLDFVMKLLYFTARESRTLRGLEDETEFSDPENKKKGQESIVR